MVFFVEFGKIPILSYKISQNTTKTRRQIKPKAEKESLQKKETKNAACGDDNPRVRRWSFPRAALVISAGGVWKPRMPETESTPDMFGFRTRWKQKY